MYKQVISKVCDAPPAKSLLKNGLEETTSSTQLVSFVNPFSYTVLRKTREVATEVDFFYSDALVTSLVFSIFSRKRIPRLSFDYGSFAKVFFESVSKTDKSVYLIGSKADQIENAVDAFKNKYPGLNISGFRHGYFSDENEMHSVANEIANTKSTFVVCGMGTPHQEKFGAILKNTKSSIQQIYTCGGFLHQSAEKLQYYPQWINQFNLRWAYRAVKEEYVLKRLLVQYPMFLALSLVDFFKREA